MSAVAQIRGREQELALLESCFQEARAGRSSVVLLEGAAGLGKSRLIEEATRLAGQNGMRLHGAAAEPGGRLVAVGPYTLLLAALLGEDVIAQGPSPTPVTLDELAAMVQRAAARAPLVMWLDDLQWAGPTTALALPVLVESLSAAPIVWLMAHRPEVCPVIGGMLDELRRDGALALTLERLDENASVAVAQDILGASPSREVLDLARRADGSPYLLTELFRGLGDEGLIQISGEQAELTADDLPARIRETMHERLERLSDLARAGALAAAVLGRHFPFDHLAKMLRLAPGQLLAALDELTRDGLLDEKPGGLIGFRHDLVREAVRKTLSGDRRQILEQRAVEILVAAGASPAEVAVRMVASVQPGDRAAAATLLEAANALGPTDPSAAGELGLRAFELVEPRDPLRFPLVTVTSRLLHAAGRAQEGRTFADNALHDTLGPDQEASVRLEIADMLSISADDRAQMGRAALALDGVSDALRARHLARLISNLVGAGRLQEALIAADAARVAVDDAHDDRAARHLAWSLTLLDYATGHYGRALERLDPLRAGAWADGSLDQQWALALTRINAVVQSPRRAFDWSTPYVLEAEAGSLQWATRMWALDRSMFLLAAGELDHAREVLDVSAEMNADSVLNAMDAAGGAVLSQIALRAGDAAGVERCAAMGAELIVSSSPEIRRHGAWLLALQAADRGDHAAAVGALERAGCGRDASVLPVFPHSIGDPAALIRIALAVGDQALVASSVALAQARCARNPGLASLRATADHACGLAEQSPDLLAMAAGGLGRAGRPLEQADALRDAGDVLLERRTRREAVQVLGDALGIYGRCGATNDVARVRSMLRELGIRRRIVARTRPESGWDALTEAEGVVARFAADGLTNRQIASRLVISPHTVSTHVRHTFAKLGINSRTELASLVEHHRSAVGV